MSDYDRIARAITFITDQVDRQPTLDEVAAHAHLSPSHFQRLFSRWAGVSPKRYLQTLTVERAKYLLGEARPVLEVSDSVGLSGGSRLYDHFVRLEAVTPGEYKLRGAGLRIEHAVHPTPFGEAFIALTPRGICDFAFVDQPGSSDPLMSLRTKWPKADLIENPHRARLVIDSMFCRERRVDRPLSLHVSGTNFQINVWKALLRIPRGQVATYREVAEAIGRPQSARAVGQAVGANPVAFVIPCHRVIRSSGALGGYRWGVTRKQTMHAWEMA